MDEFTARRQAREAADTAWFLAEWERLDPADRAALDALVRKLHEKGLTPPPGRRRMVDGLNVAGEIARNAWGLSA